MKRTTLTRVVLTAILGGVWMASAGHQSTVATQSGGAGGAIRGRVTIDDIPDVRMVEVTSDQATCGDEVEDRAEVVDGSGGVANAVVVVTGAPWTTDPPTPVVNNKDCYFEPRVQVAKTRALVSIRSEDAVLHTTHAYDDRERTMFNIAIPVPGMEIERPLRRPGLWRIECDSHGWMRGWIYVTDDTAAVTGADGHFVLSGIPPGTYEVTVWHERFAGSSQTVTVTDAGTAEANFTVAR